MHWQDISTAVEIDIQIHYVSLNNLTNLRIEVAFTRHSVVDNYILNESKWHAMCWKAEEVG